jgi:DNA-directed RNA polymerase subunit omega
MARITVEDCLEQEPNRFALVLLASRRAKEVLAGAPLLIDSTDNKEVVTALREIATGKVRFMTASEELAAQALPVSPPVVRSQLDELEKLFSDPVPFAASPTSLPTQA